MRALVMTTLVLSGTALAQEPAYVPAPASQLPGYSETLLPCKMVLGVKNEIGEVEPVGRKRKDEDDVATFVVCKGEPNLAELSLRELSLLRNTIHARYGWGGFRKPWLREHFQKQPWYRPDPKFNVNRLSDVDRRNATLIAKAEMSLRMVDLEWRRDAILARVGKAWADAPEIEGGEGRRTCKAFLAHRKSRDCAFHEKPMKAAEPNLDKLTPEERIELGLLSRAMGEFAVDDGQRGQLATSLDSVLSVKELRQLSLRDLRLLRNTLFARRGRPFKSEMLQEHFAHMPWYKADPAYTDARLTKTDKLNIELIRQVEQEFGGALVDKDFQINNPSVAADRQIDPAMVA